MQGCHDSQVAAARGALGPGARAKCEARARFEGENARLSSSGVFCGGRQVVGRAIGKAYVIYTVWDPVQHLLAPYAGVRV
jgi:hypothetical protein